METCFIANGGEDDGCRRCVQLPIVLKDGNYSCKYASKAGVKCSFIEQLNLLEKVSKGLEDKA